MKYIDFCDESLSQLVLGTYGFGERIDDNTALNIMNLYVENGGKVVSLTRIRIGGLSLPDDLSPGESRLMTDLELKKLFEFPQIVDEKSL